MGFSLEKLQEGKVRNAFRFTGPRLIVNLWSETTVKSVAIDPAMRSVVARYATTFIRIVGQTKFVLQIIIDTLPLMSPVCAQ